MLFFVILAKKARVDAMWEQMNKGLSNKALNDLLKRPNTTTVKRTSQKSSTVRTFSFAPVVESSGLFRWWFSLIFVIVS